MTIRRRLIGIVGSMPVARREVTNSGDSFCKKAGDEDLLADKKVSPE